MVVVAVVIVIAVVAELFSNVTLYIYENVFQAWLGVLQRNAV